MPNWSNPSVAEQLLYFTVRLERRDSNGQFHGAGTGFLLHHEKKNGIGEFYLLTNRHVVDGVPQLVGYFTKARPEGGPDVGNVFWVDLTLRPLWRCHPNPKIDLCALPLSRALITIWAHTKDTAFILPPSSSMVADGPSLGLLEPLLPLLFVGYPNGIFDTVNHTPLLRQGVAASHPALPFNGATEFIIDAGVFPGSSGSPVLSYERTFDGQIANYRILGVLRSVMYATERGDFEMREIPTALTPVVTFDRALNLGSVIQSTRILELLQGFRDAPLLFPSTGPGV